MIVILCELFNTETNGCNLRQFSHYHLWPCACVSASLPSAFHTTSSCNRACCCQGSWSEILVQVSCRAVRDQPPAEAAEAGGGTLAQGPVASAAPWSNEGIAASRSNEGIAGRSSIFGWVMGMADDDLLWENCCKKNITSCWTIGDSWLWLVAKKSNADK
jgi:hypothetical protein